MKLLMPSLLLLASLCWQCTSTVGSTTNNKSERDPMLTAPTVNVDHFLTTNDHLQIKTVACELTDGTQTTCYQLSASSTPIDHQMGPWCPTHIEDGPEKGGIWIEGGEVYDVDGTFIKGMASFYGDATWQMYDAAGNVFVTDSYEACAQAARPNVDDTYKNYCVECLPAYVKEINQTYIIPITPALLVNPTIFAGPGDRANRGPRPPAGNASMNRPPRPEHPQNHAPNMGVRGLALNGVRFDAPAPTNHILGAYTLAPFDDAGGHINLHVGYHYHAATGKTTAISQADDHAPLIGYAMDGVAIYAYANEHGEVATDLDECRGHSDDIRGYHYHVDQPGSNNFINCLRGLTARQVSAHL